MAMCGLPTEESGKDTVLRKKNPCHLSILAWDDEIGKRLQAHEKVSDELLRRVLQKYSANAVQGGLTCQKRML